jgi:hypothetical protein
MAFVMDALPCFMVNFAKCICFLMDCGETFPYCDRLPLETFELYIIPLPFYCFVGTLELRAWGIPDIVPLSRELLTMLRNTFPL